MKWNDCGIVLSARKFGEHSAIIHLLTREHGLFAGIDRSAASRAKRGLYQTGNLVSAQWQARLAEQLGMMQCELMRPVASLVIDSRMKLAALSSAACLLEKILVERERQPALYDRAETLIGALCTDREYWKDYVRLEFDLLSCSGFGLDLERCAATGQTDGLVYVSPKTGRAVSREAGKPYHDKLLPLPDFLTPNPRCFEASMQDIVNGLKLCGHFLYERVFLQRGAMLPSPRARLFHMLQAESQVSQVPA